MGIPSAVAPGEFFKPLRAGALAGHRSKRRNFPFIWRLPLVHQELKITTPLRTGKGACSRGRVFDPAQTASAKAQGVFFPEMRPTMRAAGGVTGKTALQGEAHRMKTNYSRRDFLGTAAMAAAGATLVPPALASVMKSPAGRVAIGRCMEYDSQVTGVLAGMFYHARRHRQAGQRQDRRHQAQHDRPHQR